MSPHLFKDEATKREAQTLWQKQEHELWSPGEACPVTAWSVGFPRAAVLEGLPGWRELDSTIPLPKEELPVSHLLWICRAKTLS
jgi:hypothetical protein